MTTAERELLVAVANGVHDLILETRPVASRSVAKHLLEKILVVQKEDAEAQRQVEEKVGVDEDRSPWRWCGSCEEWIKQWTCPKCGDVSYNPEKEPDLRPTKPMPGAEG